MKFFFRLMENVLYMVLYGTKRVLLDIVTIPPNAQKLCGMMIFTILPVVNPIIYGMKTKEIRNALSVMLKKPKVAFI